VSVKPIHHAFKRMIGLEFDVAEMAIATFLQGRAFGKPLVLLPLVLLNRFHHGSIVKKAGSPLRPGDLSGKRVGVRSYTQTTGVWVRGILASEYGVDLDSVTWVTTEGGHLAEYQEPANVVRVPGANLREMLASGEIDAWIAGGEGHGLPDVEPLIADAAREEVAWYDRAGVLPINHMLVLKREIVDAHPWVPDELIRLFTAAKDGYEQQLLAAGTASDPEEAFRLRLLQRGTDPLPSGIDGLRRSLGLVIDFAYQQKLIPDRPPVEALFTR
jgi:4,5-dihydroxyphthalate decarboxylase